LLFSSHAWWEQAAWGALAAASAGLALWLWGQQWARQQATTRATTQPARRIHWLGWGLLLTGMTVVAAWAAFTAAQVLDHARSLQSHLQLVEALAEDLGRDMDVADLERAGAPLAGMQEDLEAIHAQVGPLLPLGRLLSWVPTHGGDLAAASDLLTIARGVVAAGVDVFGVLEPALGPLAEPEDTPNVAPSMGEWFLPVLIQGEPALRRAQNALDEVAVARARIDVASLSPRVGQLLQRLDGPLPWLAAAVDGALLAPRLLGSQGPRTYLVLAQNNHELRATGGFISGVGELCVEGGQVRSVHFRDGYAVDNLEVPHQVTPPEFQATLFGELWFFRDTNWDPDFPTSARRALAVYAQDQGVEADGVLALDLTALQLLVEAVGPLQPEGMDKPVTAENVLEVLQAQWGGPVQEGWREWWLHRKDFMGEIAAAALDRLTTRQSLDAVSLVRALRQSLEEKHLLIYLQDPGAAELLHKQGWDGALPDRISGSDVLLVVDTNVGFNKADAKVTRSIQYVVDLSAEQDPRAQVSLTYQHRSQQRVDECVQEARYGETYADLMDRCYWDYVRVYAPAGSELVHGPDLPLPAGSLAAREGDDHAPSPEPAVASPGTWMVWTAFFHLAPGEEKTLVFAYELPAWVLDYEPGGLVRYRLQVLKQPGTGAVPLQVAFILPPGAQVAGAIPPELQSAVTTDLRIDRAFELVFRRERGEP
jgi:hypothetical protein